MSMCRYIHVRSLEGLDGMLEKGVTSFCISTGLVRSSKEINKTEDGKFHIFHYIDDSEETLTEEELKESNIGKAMDSGNFYAFIY